jgi:adenosylhomocysteine nucleosidase
MMLRWMLTNLIRQAASRKMSAAMAAAVQQAGAAPEPHSDAALPACEIAVMFATELESRDFSARLTGGTTTRCASFVEHVGEMGGMGVVVVQTGAGMEAAGSVTADVIRVHRPAWVISAGFAGALSAELRRGHFLIADRVTDAAGSQLEIGLRIDREVMQSHRHLHVGRLLSLDKLLRMPEDRLRLGRQHAALAYDMETLAVARACSQRKVRFISARIITDTVEDRLPIELERMVSPGSWALKLGTATGALFKRPSTVKDWWSYQQRGLEASDRLAKFLVGVLPQLASKR